MPGVSDECTSAVTAHARIVPTSRPFAVRSRRAVICRDEPAYPAGYSAATVSVNTTEAYRLSSPPRNPDTKSHPYGNDREWAAYQYRGKQPGHAVLSQVHVKSPIPPDYESKSCKYSCTYSKPH